MSFCLRKFSIFNLQFSIFLMCLLSVVSACTTDTYESGDGEYSYMRGDFANLRTDTKGNIVSFLTDENNTITLKEPLAFSDAKPDTIYRALVYYSKPQKEDAEILNLKMVNVTKAFVETKEKKLKTDPVGWESMWISNNKSYLNLSLNLLDGVSEDENTDMRHVVGICQDSIVGSHFYYTLYHDQGGIPEYYTRKTYLSMPLGDSFHDGDILTVTVHTYEGIQTKTVIVP